MGVGAKLHLIRDLMKQTRQRLFLVMTAVCRYCQAGCASATIRHHFVR